MPKEEEIFAELNLTEEEAISLLALVGAGSDTGNEEWDKEIKSIEEKLKNAFKY